MSAQEVPIRQRSAYVPKPKTSIERRCRGCGAAFLPLAPGATGERGIWAQAGNGGHWWCSIDCTPSEVLALVFPEVCSMCKDAPATTTWGLPVCQPCADGLTALQVDLKEMEDADPMLKEMGERVEDAARRFIEASRSARPAKETD